MTSSSNSINNSAINNARIDKCYTCIHCLTPSNNLYKSYSPSSSSSNNNVNSIKLTCCSHCQNDVDHYIEQEFLLVWIDMVLLRLPAYRHVLFNRFLHFNQQYLLLQHQQSNNNNNNKNKKNKNKDDNTLLHLPAYSKNTLMIWMLCIIILFKSIMTMTFNNPHILFDSTPTTISTYATTTNQSFTIINNNQIPILYFLPPQLRTILSHSLSPCYSVPLPSFTSLHTLYLFTILYSTMEFFIFYIVTILSTKISIHYVYAPLLHHQYHHRHHHHRRLHANSTTISNSNTKIDSTNNNNNYNIEWNDSLLLYTPMQNALQSGILLLQSFIYTCAVFCSIYEQYYYHQQHHHHDNPNTVHYVLGSILNGIYHSFMVYTIIEWFHYNYVRTLREKYDGDGNGNGTTDNNNDNSSRNNNNSIKVLFSPSLWIMLFMVVWICSLGFVFEWLGPRLMLRCIHSVSSRFVA